MYFSTGERDSPALRSAIDVFCNEPESVRFCHIFHQLDTLLLDPR